MRALLKRYFRSISFSGVAGNFVGQVLVRYLVAMALGGAAISLAGGAVLWLGVMIPISLVLFLVLMLRAQPVIRTRKHLAVLPPLMASQEEYCLLLRPFGYDGQIILADLPPLEKLALPWWRRPAQGPVRRTKPIELVLAQTVRRTLGMRTLCVVDQSLLFAPPGPDYLRAPNDQWQSVVHQLIGRAHTVLVLIPPDLPIGQGMEWEIRMLSALGLESRVIFVAAPVELARDSVCPAVHQVLYLMALLRLGPHATRDQLRRQALELEPLIRPETLVARRNDLGELESLYAVHPEGEQFRKWKSVSGVGTYDSAVAQLLDSARQELGDLGFAARYERSGHAAPLLPDAQEGTGECIVCGWHAEPPGQRTRRRAAVVVGVLLLAIVLCVAVRLVQSS